jgi:type IV pilus assembly protein PilF
MPRTRVPSNRSLAGRRLDLTPDRALARALAGAALLALLALGACRTTTTVDGVQVDAKTAVPGAVEADKQKRAAARLQLAADYYQRGQLQIAIDRANEAVALDPTNAGAYGLLGLMLLDAGQPERSRESFNRAMALDPRSPELNNNFGWYLCQTGHEADSIAYFDKAAGDPLYRTPVVALQNAGICELRLHQDAQAEQYLLRALRADGTSPMVKFQLAQMYLHQRRFDRCDFYFGLLSGSVEANADTLWLGVRIAHAKGDANAERSYREQLQTRFPGSPQADALHRGRFDD